MLYAVVGIAATYETAVALAAEKKPALVLMDIGLVSERDGIDAAIEIHRTFSVPSLFTSTNIDPENMDRAKAASPVGWVPKLYSPEVINEAAAEALIRARWPRVKILLRADSGFAREGLMAWCEANRVDFLFGLARNARLVEHIHVDLAWAEHEAERSGRPARRFADFRWRTRDSWSRRRRVVAKAEWMPGRGEAGANPRFVVTSLPAAEIGARALYERVYCARGDMENRIKECQLDLFADRTSAATMRANQLRLWFASMAYVLLAALRRIALAHTRLERATCGTIRLKLLKIGAQVTRSVRRIRIAMASACPCADIFALAHTRLCR